MPPTSKPASAPDSLVTRSNGWLHFVKRGWAKQKSLVAVFVDAIARTAMFEHLPLLSVGGAVAKPRGAVAAIKTAFKSGKSRYALLEGGKTIHSEETTAFIEVELSPGGADITTAVRGTVLAKLGARALDDFFTLFTSLHDDLAGAAHVVCATAWTDWDDNAASPTDTSDWPLRAIADVLEPSRPVMDEDDVFWEAAQAIAKARPPAGAERTNHGGLVMLRWARDPSDARAASAAAVKHATWVKGLVKTEPVPKDSRVYIPE